ncbi:hypothetical protein [Methylorubrum sp. SB2]|uniref:hypothetical protein n=1 Tax=Methylorubrum subtropicum TaxID=3138812 RepID=UPI00313B6EA4
MAEEQKEEKKTKACTSCGDQIPHAAVVCRQCRNYQGRWWWWRTAGVSLPWFVAAASLVTLAFQNFKEVRSTFGSELDVSIVSTDDVGNLNVSFSNGGKVPAIYRNSGFVSCDQKEVSPKNYGWEHMSTLIMRGEHDVVPPMRVDLVIFSPTAELVGYLRTKKDADCEVLFSFVDGKGQGSVKAVQLDEMTRLGIVNRSKK